MDSLDLSDAALDNLSDSDLRKTAKKIGMTVPRQKEEREQTLKRIRARRDLPVGSTDTSGPGLNKEAARSISWGSRLCINVQAVAIAVVGTGLVWYYLGKIVYKIFMPTYDLKGALEIRAWVDYLCVFVFGVLLALWWGPAKRLGPMFIYLPSSGVSLPSRPDPGTKVQATEDAPASIPAQKNMRREVALSARGENETEREYDKIHRHYLQDESVIRNVPDFPTSVQYYQLSKAGLLERLAYALRHDSRLQRDLETVQTEINGLIPSQLFESPSPVATGTDPGFISMAHGFDGSSPAVENIRVRMDKFRKYNQQLTEQVEAERGKTAASEQKMLEIQEERREERKKYREMESQVEIVEERRRKGLEEAQKEYANLRAELIRLRGKVWIYLRLRPKVNSDQADQYIDLISPDDFNHSVVLRGDAKNSRDTHYEFDRVFHQTDTNRDIYQHVRPMVQAAIEGLDVAIILEGPSGSGKSHTMFGRPDGIAFSIAGHVLQSSMAGKEVSSQMRVRIANFKVYREKILDAMVSKGENPPLHIKEASGAKTQVYRDQQYKSRVDGTSISTTEELTSEFMRMLKAREQRETAQNATSSRGHAVCKLEFSSPNMSTGETRISTLFLVDLAGPESFQQSQTPEETRTITQGRTELRHRLCEMIEIHQLDTKSEKRKTKTQELRRQLKNSKLTHILQDCFLGEPRILFIGTVNPYAAAEHRSRIKETFEFARKMRNLEANHDRFTSIPNTP